MAQATADFEAGTLAATIATTDTGSANAWNAVFVPSGGGGLTYDNTHVAHGSKAAKIVTGNPGSTGTLEWSSGTLGTISPHFFGRIYLWTSANPLTNVVTLVHVRSGSNSRGRVKINLTGKIELTDATNVVQQTSTTSIGLSQWIRVEFHYTMSLTVGQIEVLLFNTADSTTPTETITTAATLNLAGVGANDCQFSWGTNLNQTAWFDDIVAGAVAYPGPSVGAGFTNTVPPTVTGNLLIGSTVTANAGTWTPTPGSYSYYWHRADDAVGTNLQEIAGATGATYTLDPVDTSKYIQAGVIPLP